MSVSAAALTFRPEPVIVSFSMSYGLEVTGWFTIMQGFKVESHIFAKGQISYRSSSCVTSQQNSFLVDILSRRRCRRHACERRGVEFQTLSREGGHFSAVSFTPAVALLFPLAQVRRDVQQQTSAQIYKLHFCSSVDLMERFLSCKNRQR